MTKLIGLAGKAGSGKNALADYIVGTDVSTYLQDSFAYPMKAGLAAMLDITISELESLKDSGKVHDSLSVSIRTMMQTLATEWGRELINKDMWRILARERIEKRAIHKFAPITIMTDIRFSNEAELIHQLGGKVIYIDRAKDQCRDVGSHVSENSLDESLIDFTIYNNSDLAGLYKSWDELAFLIRQD